MGVYRTSFLEWLQKNYFFSKMFKYACVSLWHDMTEMLSHWTFVTFYNKTASHVRCDVLTIHCDIMKRLSFWIVLCMVRISQQVASVMVKIDPVLTTVQISAKANAPSSECWHKMVMPAGLCRKTFSCIWFHAASTCTPSSTVYWAHLSPHPKWHLCWLSVFVGLTNVSDIVSYTEIQTMVHL